MSAFRSESGTAPPGEETREAAGEAARRCPLCGYRFSADSLNCHAGCPLSAKCRVLCCPGCGYEFIDTAPTERRLAAIRSFFRRLLRIPG
jgi:hypothetical protein